LKKREVNHLLFEPDNYKETFRNIN